MVKYLSIIFVVFLMGNFDACQDQSEKCEKTKAPEINFKFLIGGIITISEFETYKDLTNEYEGHDLLMMMNKAYCNGKINGPFEVPYLISTDGLMVKQSIGAWSFRMDNTEDYMNVNFFLDGHDLGAHNYYYDMLKKDDGGSAYFEIDIHTQWDKADKKFKNTAISDK
jgi:hypothetical protein